MYILEVRNEFKIGNEKYPYWKLIMRKLKNGIQLEMLNHDGHGPLYRWLLARVYNKERKRVSNAVYHVYGPCIICSESNVTSRLRGRSRGGEYRAHLPPPPPPPLQAQQLPFCTSDLPFVQKIQPLHKISDILATISMISDERTMIFLSWYRC